MNQTQNGIIGIDDKIGVGKSLFLGLQSVLACNLFLGPVVIIGALKMNVTSAAAFIAMTFLACGIATIIQSGFFMKYPIIQGMSFATIGAVLALVAKSDFATAFGSLIPASIIIILIGYLGIFSKIVKKFIPAIVSGTVIICIGVSLMFIVWNSLVNAPGGNVSNNFLEAGVSFVVLIVLMYLGKSPTLTGQIIRMGSVVYAMIIGTIFASFFGHVDLSPVASAPWFAFPKLFPFGAPKIDIMASLVMTFILLVVLVESLGSWYTVAVLANEEMSEKRINKGVIGEGFGCLIGTFLGGIPVTSYGSNAGVIAVTKVYSRWTSVGAGAIVIAMALCPKLMSLIAAVPGSVIWGVFAVICILILSSGFQSISHFKFSERNYMIIGISVLATIGASLMPPAVVAKMPLLISYLFGSSIAVGAVVAVIINLLLPKEVEAPNTFDLPENVAQ
ncbi:uracil-xanthine permease family protein [Desulfosporosinus fructosivorans]